MDQEEKDAMCTSTGQRIRELREGRHISKEKLAELVGITTQYLGDLERGQKCMNYTILAQFSRQLGVSTDYLCFGRFTLDPAVEEMNRRLMELAPFERELVAHILQQTAQTVAGLGREP